MKMDNLLLLTAAFETQAAQMEACEYIPSSSLRRVYKAARVKLLINFLKEVYSRVKWICHWLHYK